ncbi:MAG TPA: DUF3052 domain-containing protein [Actinomycetota bacterium]
MSTPLARKLGIKAGSSVVFVGQPDGFEGMLEPLPRGVSIATRVEGPHDVVVLFAHRRSALERRLPSLRKALDYAGGLWIAYPKKASGVPSDLDFAVVQETGLAAGLVDNKSSSIDETWTAVRFVYRLSDRPEVTAPTTG